MQSDQNDAFLRAVAQQIRERVGQFGRRAQRDLVLGAVAFVSRAVDVVVRSGLPDMPFPSGGFAVSGVGPGPVGSGSLAVFG
ncbi:hypothetical protein GCM10022403_087430 [Streptomyces coacervatus]|uniref:Uncharacterized protein n=1 Tax=Streptomyces coacervatus TaxID=647381 RepID=A0ABP7JD67_9ACTN